MRALSFILNGTKVCKKSNAFKHAIKRGWQWAGPEAGRPKEAAALLGWSLPGGGVRGYHDLGSQTAEQRQKSVTGTNSGCGIVGIGETLGRRHKDPECEGSRLSTTLLLLPGP